MLKYMKESRNGLIVSLTNFIKDDAGRIMAS